jgi:hypothetical protein
LAIDASSQLGVKLDFLGPLSLAFCRLNRIKPAQGIVYAGMLADEERIVAESIATTFIVAQLPCRPAKRIE